MSIEELMVLRAKISAYEPGPLIVIPDRVPRVDQNRAARRADCQCPEVPRD